jgi:hypothetical protein
LRKGISVAKATDIAYSLLSPDYFHVLVLDLKWSPVQWERSVTDMLCTYLLD